MRQHAQPGSLQRLRSTAGVCRAAIVDIDHSYSLRFQGGANFFQQGQDVFLLVFHRTTTTVHSIALT